MKIIFQIKKFFLQELYLDRLVYVVAICYSGVECYKLHEKFDIPWSVNKNRQKEQWFFHLLEKNGNEDNVKELVQL